MDATVSCWLCLFWNEKSSSSVNRNVNECKMIFFLFAFVWACEQQYGDWYLIDITIFSRMWKEKLLNIVDATTSLFVFSRTVAKMMWQKKGTMWDYCSIRLLYINTRVERLTSQWNAPAEGPSHCMLFLGVSGRPLNMQMGQRPVLPPGSFWPSWYF